jgi:hypothetical protein
LMAAPKKNIGDQQDDRPKVAIPPSACDSEAAIQMVEIDKVLV